MDTIDYNRLVGQRYRRRLNLQRNRLVMRENRTVESHEITHLRYVLGVGEKHFRQFRDDMNIFTAEHPWLVKKHVPFILTELIVNSQFSMLRRVVERVPQKKPVAGYFYLVAHVCDEFISAGIEEFGDKFDYQSYMEQKEREAFDENFLPPDSDIITLDDFREGQLKLVLSENAELIVPDGSNQIGLSIIENATDHDFFISSFYREGEYNWKRVYFRVENDIA